MKKIYIVLLVIVIGLSLSSCMMMMPGHMSAPMPETHNHDSSIVKNDPVCGKQVEEGSSFTYEYHGYTYYFDTEQCLSVFKSNPDHFMQKPMNDTHKKTWTKVGWIGGAVVMTTMMVIMLVRIF
jgi:YHS domain-containing protein